jgi:pilus assembly protein Flp/PilA
MTQLQKFIGLRITQILAGISSPRFRSEEGQSLAEYALILALIAVVVAGVLVTLQGSISGIFDTISSKL